MGTAGQGWAVAATARKIAPGSDPAVLAVPGDLSVSSTADRVVEETLGTFGRIDTLVNNAGVYLSKALRRVHGRRLRHCGRCQPQPGSSGSRSWSSPTCWTGAVRGTS